MPNVGLPKLKKKLRMMDFWGPKWMETKFSQSYASPLTSVAISWYLDSNPTTSMGSTHENGDGEMRTMRKDYINGAFTGTIRYTDGYDIYGDHFQLSVKDKRIIISDLPPGVIVHRAIVMMRYRDIVNESGVLSHLDEPGPFSFHVGANRLTVDRINEDVSTRRYASALALPINSMRVPANGTSPGQTIYGVTNVKDVVSENGDYYVYWMSPYLNGSIKFHDLQYGLRIYYK